MILQIVWPFMLLIVRVRHVKECSNLDLPAAFYQAEWGHFDCPQYKKNSVFTFTFSFSSLISIKEENEKVITYLSNIDIVGYLSRPGILVGSFKSAKIPFWVIGAN